MKMRLIIINDSLGMTETKVGIEKTWTNTIMRRFKDRFEIYFVQRRGLLSGDVHNSTDSIIIDFRPDMVIIQVGIADCRRRALPRRFLHTVSRIPIVNARVHNFAFDHHYQLSRFFDIRYTKEDAFKKNLSEAVNKFIASGVEASNIAIILIAPPGPALLKKVYAITENVAIYNKIILTLATELGIVPLDPYHDCNTQDLLLDDGFHLSPYGHQIVAQSVAHFLEYSSVRASIF
jgi:acyl-CoA thioesterase I